MIFVLFDCFWGCQSQVIDVRASMTWLVMCTAQWNIIILTKVRLELVNSFLSNYYWACMLALNHKEESSKGIEQAHWRVVPLQRHTRSHTNAESWTHARAILCTHALSHMTRKARIKRSLNFEKAIDLFEIKKKQRNNANFRARLLDCPATLSEILISRQWNKQKSSASRDRHELRPNLVLWTPPPPVKQLRIFPNVPEKKRPRIPIKLAI